MRWLMQDLRFYLLIEDKEKESEVRIDGNLETLRELIHALRADLAPVISLRAEGELMDTQEARVMYLQNDFDPIPLKPQSKLPAAKAWQSKPTITQWRYAAPDSNIGLRAGNGKAFIDCDDKNHPGTTETITR